MTPNGWHERTLNEVFDYRMGFAFRSSDFTKEGIQLIRMANLYKNRLALSRAPVYLPENFAKEYPDYVLCSGDLVMSLTGTMGKRDYGFAVQISMGDDKFLLNQRVVRLDCKEGFNKGFALQLLQSEIFLSPLYRFPGGTKQANLSIKNLLSLSLPFPPLSQQQTIAAILSTWDRAIELTEKLIAAKQKRKQALMQQLLSGKVRLPHYMDKWNLMKAGDIFKPVSIKNHSSERVLSVTQNMGVVYRDEMERKIGMNMDTTGSYKLVEPGDFVISLRSFQGGLEMSRIRGIVSPAYHVIRPVIEIDKEFFRHFLKSYEFVERLAVAVIGIRDGKQINFADFTFLKFKVPPIDEQRAVGQLLTAAEREVAMLERKASALKHQKRGLMQQLLTGKVRVKVDNGDSGE